MMFKNLLLFELEHLLFPGRDEASLRKLKNDRWIIRAR